MPLLNLNLLATAPGGVVRLRELILTLAVQGKLVPQDPKDEPASALLKKIRAEKDRLIAEGKIKRDKPLTEVLEEEKPFGLPASWELVRLNKLLPEFQNGASSRGDVGGKSVTVLRLADIKNRRISLADTRQIPITERDILKYHLQVGDILITRVNGSADIVGQFNLCEAAVDAIYCDHFIRMRVSRQWIEPTYLALVSESSLMRGRIKELFITTAGQKTVNQGHIGSLQFGLPPLAEQSRIVTRVEELMRLCDALEAKGQLEATQHAQLVCTLLATLTDSESPEQLADNWHRIATHFDLLLDRPQAIDALEQTILQLAVRGQLVPQDPQDEPASALLKKIRAEKDELIAEGKIKRDKPLPPIAESDQPFALPVGWEWVRLNALLQKIGAGSTPLGGREVYVSSGVKFLRSQNVWDDGLRLGSVAFIKPEIHERMSGTVVVANDLLFNITGASIGRCAVVPSDFDEANVSQHVTIVRTVLPELNSFLHEVLVSRHVQKAVMDVQVGVSREGLSIAKLGQFLIPMPPLAEQSRIVTRVAQLRRLCFELRQRLFATQSTQAHLAEALVTTAVS
jgi:type I restriction enzyme, S subunit